MGFQQCGMCEQQSLRSACAYAQSADRSLCWSLECFMSVKLLTERQLEFPSLKGGCTAGSSESTIVKIPHCWKSHVTAHFIIIMLTVYICTHFKFYDFDSTDQSDADR